VYAHIQDSHESSTISKGTYHLFIGNLIFTVAAAITSIAVGRILGPDRFGLYSIAITVPVYVYLFLQLGISSTTTRFSARYLSEGDPQRAYSFSYSISILHLGIGTLAVLILLPFTSAISTEFLHRPEMASEPIIPLALLSVIGQILFNDVSGAFVGLQKFGKAAMFQIINGLVKLILSVSLVLADYSVVGAVAGYTFGFVSAGMISLIHLVLANKRIIPNKVIESTRNGLKYAPPIYLSYILLNVISPFQFTILAYSVSNTQIGWYAAAVSVGTLISLFTYPVSTAVLPMFSKTTQGVTTQLAGTFRLSVKYAALFIVPITFAVMAFSLPLSIAIYGEAYSSAGNYLFVYVMINLLAGAGSLSDSQFLYGIGETRKALVATSTGSAVSILVSLVLVFILGVYGILVGTLLGQVISLCINLKYISIILETKAREWVFGRVFLSSAISALLVYPLSLLKFSPFMILPIGAALFIVILIPIMTVTRALCADDMTLLSAQFKDVRVLSFVLDSLSKYQIIFEHALSRNLQSGQTD
jgi:stage V sporulation protein B